MKNKALLLSLVMALSASLNAQIECLEELNLDLPDSLEVSCDSCITLTTSFPQLFNTSEYVVEAMDDATPPYPLNQGNIVVSTTDDIWSPAIPMGFSFCFFDNAYSSIVIGSNGIVTFDLGDADGGCPWSFTAQAPSAALPNNAIFCPFHDINPATCGSVRWEIYGEEPCRTFVVSFDDVCMFSCTSLQSSSQLVLYESTNIIEVYIVEKNACAWNSGSTLIGIQNDASNVAYTPPGRNTGNWTAFNEAWRFVPDGDAIGSVTWYEDGIEIATGDSLSVCPDSATTYVAALNYDFCAAPLAGDDCANYAINVSSGTWPTEVDWDLVNENGVTVLSGGAPYNQTACLPNGCYTLNMFDSFGDGWNGANFTISGEDGIIATATVPSGSFGTASFCVDDFIPIDEEDPEPIEAFLIDSTFVEVLFDDIDPGLMPAPILCSYDELYQLEAVDSTGVWGSNCDDCLDQNGIFDITSVEVGTYTITYTVEGACGPVVDSTEVVVEDPPLIALEGPEFLCVFSDPVAILPNIEGGVFEADCGDCIDENGVFNPQGLTPGIYTVSYAAGINCFASAEYEIVVEETLDLGVFFDLPDCETLVVDFGEGFEQTGTWSADCGDCIDENGVFSGPDAGPGFWTVTFLPDDNCAVEAFGYIELLPEVDATINTTPELCEDGEVVGLSANDPNGVWGADCGDCITPLGDFDPTVSGPGTFNISYSINGYCSDSDNSTITVLPRLNAYFSMPDYLCLDLQEFAPEVQDEGGEWSATCMTCIDEESGVVDLLAAGAGELTVTYILDGLCGDTHEEVAELAPCSIIIPNIFSPNGDGINDFLRFENLEFFPGSSLEVRNRWGVLVFQSDNYQNNWRAEEVSPGTYYFVLRRSDGEVHTGDITVVLD
ncbi:MAG: gliding motility-associated C-terminal domain-containing protein [Flavobacteriales bacterium]|nr:gliding motility-associated C-terminal domain-containing protein [Flavobacteriales bacterium]